MSVPESDRLFVRKKNLARCAWCGTPESPKWITTQRNEIFCSPQCQAAKYSSGEINLGFLCVCCGGIVFFGPFLFLILYFPVLPYSSGNIGGLMVGGFIYLIMGIALMISGRRGRRYLDRKGKYSNIALLQCEYCTQTNPPSTTQCQYCGAPLTRAPFTYETAPPWIQDQTTDRIGIRRLKCPYCNAIYSYNVLKMESDGRIRCPNCHRPFLSPSPE